MRQTEGDDDLADRLDAAERGKAFATESAAKKWAEENTGKDEYESPRLERQTFDREYPEVPAYWQRGEEREWTEGAWHPV